MYPYCDAVGGGYIFVTCYIAGIIVVAQIYNECSVMCVRICMFCMLEK